MQEVDAERRIQILRGLHVDPLPSPPSIGNEKSEERSEPRDNTGREKKRRRIAGEDDTSRDIRLAQERSVAPPERAKIQAHRNREIDTPLTDNKGHINLFPPDHSRAGRASKNPEAEAEAAAKKKEFEDQYTMRFSNAAGFKQAVGKTPWYHTARLADNDDNDNDDDADPKPTANPSKDVWGNEDPRRHERDKQRTAAADPLALMQQGISGLRAVEAERREQRKREARKAKRRKNNDDDDDVDVEDLNLEQEPAARKHRRHHHHHHHRRPRPRHAPGESSKPSRTGWQAGPGGRYSSQFAERG